MRGVSSVPKVSPALLAPGLQRRQLSPSLCQGGEMTETCARALEVTGFGAGEVEDWGGWGHSGGRRSGGLASLALGGILQLRAHVPVRAGTC